MKLLVIFGMLGIWLLSSVAVAQTVISVSLQTGTLAWDAPVASPTSSLPTHYLITCGPTVTRVNAPATAIPVRDFIAGPGSYTCTLQAVNGFGSSASTAIPVFAAGYAPDDVVGIRLEVR